MYNHPCTRCMKYSERGSDWLPSKVVVGFNSIGWHICFLSWRRQQQTARPRRSSDPRTCARAQQLPPPTTTAAAAPPAPRTYRSTRLRSAPFATRRRPPPSARCTRAQPSPAPRGPPPHRVPHWTVASAATKGARPRAAPFHTTAAPVSQARTRRTRRHAYRSTRLRSVSCGTRRPPPLSERRGV